MAVTARQGTRLSHVSDFRRAPSHGVGRAVHASAQAMPEGGVGHVGACRAQWNETQGQRLEEHKAISDGRMQQAESQPGCDGAGVAGEAEALDAREDVEWGRDRRGDELPAWNTENSTGWRWWPP